LEEAAKSHRLAEAAAVGSPNPVSTPKTACMTVIENKNCSCSGKESGNRGLTFPRQATLLIRTA